MSKYDKENTNKTRSADQTGPKSKEQKQSTASDPHQAREAEKYANPIPSREFLLKLLDERNAPATHPELADELQFTDPDNIEALRRRLIAMVRDGQLLCNRRNQFLPISRVNLLKGNVIGHRDGFGFVKLDEGGDDLYLSARQMQTVFDGDRVLVRTDGEDNRGKKHAVIVDILERNTDQFVGRLYREGNIVLIEVENVRISQQILIDSEHSADAKHGQYVVVQIIHQPTKRTLATGKVIEVLGDHMAPGMEIDVAIRSYNIPFEWPAAVQEAVKTLKPEVSDLDKSQRIDIRHLPLVTIDGEDARDFDDAVYCQRIEANAENAGGWKLYVAIADVSHYVEPESPLDIEAHNRATSVYFPDHVVPMLPEVLSNGLCSLNPKVDRLCMVCEMDINPAGEVIHSSFYEGVMHSHARLTYNQVGTILEEPDSDNGIQLSEDFADLLPELHELYALYNVLVGRRQRRGAIDFDTVETKIVFGEERKIEAIVPTVRNDAHKIIEECMLCANVATAEFLSRHKIPALYRIHEGPSVQKLENVRSFLSEQGLQLMGGESPDPSDYQTLISDIKERPDFSVLQTVLLRSMSQAVYGPEEKGHFGLAYEHYAHFTSPIRRYPDLLVHRAIKSVIFSNKAVSDVKRPEGVDLTAHTKRYVYPYDLAKMLVLGEHCSMAERRADEATRDVMNWLKCEYLQQHLGEAFEGIISAVTGFGFFVELAGLYAEGLVHVSTLNSDYYQYDNAKHRLLGERTGMSYCLGDRVMVEVSNINLDDRKVDLLLVSSEPRSRAKKKKLGRGEPGKTSNKRRSSKPGGKDAKSRKPKSGASKPSPSKNSTSKTSTTRPGAPRSAESKPSEAKKTRRKKDTVKTKAKSLESKSVKPKGKASSAADGAKVDSSANNDVAPKTESRIGAWVNKVRKRKVKKV
jgi:ribonuclease R